MSNGKSDDQNLRTVYTELCISYRARSAGGMSVAHSASCGFTSAIETKLAKRAT